MLNLIINEWHPLLTGLWNTILCSLIALIGSLIIGTFFALLEISQHRVAKVSFAIRFPWYIRSKPATKARTDEFLTKLIN